MTNLKLDPIEIKEAVELGRIAYEAHFRLCEHYSSLIFRARISIMTLILIVVAFVFGIMLQDSNALGKLPGLPTRAILAYIGAILINLLYLMEIGYLKRFYQVVAGGRALEGRVGLQSYFTIYDRSESWPLHAAYGLAVLVLVASSALLIWEGAAKFVGRVILIAADMFPVAIFLGATFRLKRCIGKTIGNVTYIKSDV
jgi:hypothetical protein